jgi:hypothetical protein
MTMNSETTIDEDLVINFPAARKPPQGSTRFWSMAGAHFDAIAAIKPRVEPSLSVAAMEQADSKSVR